MRAILLGALVLVGCVCGPGEASCGQSCSNLLDDRLNCGGCGRVCDYRCAGGTCISAPECGPEAARPDCDDHEPCNGVETCMRRSDGSYRCVAGTPMSCTDGVRCTLDRCSAGVCTSSPVDSSCASGEMCDPVANCVTRCDHAVCGLVAPQCGCPSGQACLATGVAPVCGTAGRIALGGRCSADGDCQAGLGCVSISADGTFGMCSAFCDDDVDCGSGDPLCVDQGHWSDEASVGVCSAACNLVTSAGCPSGSKCTFVRETTSSPDITGCLAPVGTAALDGSCTNDLSCGRGLVCLRLSATGTLVCRQWCRTTADCTTSGRTCRPVSPAVLVNGISYGACQ